MAFELMTLPYSYDALEPYMSTETLHYHHDKHHQAYVDMLNKLLPGSGFEGKSSRRSSRRATARTRACSTTPPKTSTTISSGPG